EHGDGVRGPVARAGHRPLHAALVRRARPRPAHGDRGARAGHPAHRGGPHVRGLSLDHQPRAQQRCGQVRGLRTAGVHRHRADEPGDARQARRGTHHRPPGSRRPGQHRDVARRYALLWRGSPQELHVERTEEALQMSCRQAPAILDLHPRSDFRCEALLKLCDPRRAAWRTAACFLLSALAAIAVAPGTTRADTLTVTVPILPDSIRGKPVKPIAQELAEADSILRLRGGSHAENAQLFLSWDAPWGQKRARRERRPACADSTVEDTLYLSVMAGRD